MSFNKFNELTPVSVVVFAYNEELNIENALKSVANWCAETFVVDSGSSDRTLEISKKYTDLIYSHPYEDHSSQWDWTLKKLPFSYDWVLRLDADQIITEKSKMQISQVLQNDSNDVDGYFIVHKHFFRNRPIRGLNTYWLSLIRHSQTRIDKSELVDFRFLVNGKTKVLSGEIIENNQKELEIDFWLDKHQKFSSRIAIEEVLRNSGYLKWSSDLQPSLFGNPDERVLWLKNRWYRMPLYVRPFLFFFYRYFIRLGFLDGLNGFLYHFFQAFWFRLLVDIKIAELRTDLSAGRLSIEEMKTFYVHQK